MALATRQWGQEGTWAAWRRRLPHPAKWVLGASCAGRTDRQMRAFTGVPSQPSPSFQGVCQDLMHPGRPMLGRRTGGARLSQASLGMARPRGGCEGPRCPPEKPRRPSNKGEVKWEHLGLPRPGFPSDSVAGPSLNCPPAWVLAPVWAPGHVAPPPWLCAMVLSPVTNPSWDCSPLHLLGPALCRVGREGGTHCRAFASGVTVPFQAGNQEAEKGIGASLAHTWTAAVSSKAGPSCFGRWPQMLPQEGGTWMGLSSLWSAGSGLRAGESACTGGGRWNWPLQQSAQKVPEASGVAAPLSTSDKTKTTAHHFRGNVCGFFPTIC